MQPSLAQSPSASSRLAAWNPNFDSGTPAVRIDNLSFSYTNCEPALENVSLAVEQGDFLAIIGPNGGGKSTLLRLILGLLRPQQGAVSVFGSSPSTVSRHIGYVPQFSTMQPDFPASVLDMTLMGAACPGALGGSWPTGRKAREKALGYLDLLGLGDCARQPVGSLSGGQRQRALVARALMGRPAGLHQSGEEQTGAAPFLLLLDEPTASIDPQGKFCFYEFLGKLRGSVSIIVVSHDLFMASPFFSHIVFVNRTLTGLTGNELSVENLNVLFGQHLHDCPIADLQHAGCDVRHSGCSHPACTHETAGLHANSGDAESTGCDCQHSSSPVTKWSGHEPF